MVKFIYQLIHFVVLCYNFQLMVQDSRLAHYTKRHVKEDCQYIFFFLNSLSDDDTI